MDTLVADFGAVEGVLLDACCPELDETAPETPLCTPLFGAVTTFFTLLGITGGEANADSGGCRCI